MAQVPPFDPETFNRTLVECSACSWCGKGQECNTVENDLMKCPKCGNPVEKVSLRITVNGVVFDDPRRLDIRLDVSPEGAMMEAIRVSITGGGTLTVHNEHAPALDVCGEGGYLVLEGTYGIHVHNEDPAEDKTKPFGRNAITIRSVFASVVGGSGPTEPGKG